ncbi:MAG: acyltransferase [Proteobacteria bacterium]|nr:acyltransferase [Pseudomonadota bacterium]
MDAPNASIDDDALPIPAILPGLDGLRAVSILLVMLSHSGLGHVVPGVFGVTIFFFISGFLITSLMIGEWRRHGRLAIGSFYARRMIRLYPPLIVMTLVTVLVMTAVGASIHPLGVIGALAYLANYLAILKPEVMANLGGQLWSLAVEEHFYFVYPLLMPFLFRHARLAVPVLLSICALSLAIRYGVVRNFPAIATDYTGKATECRFDSILYGAIAAVLWWSRRGRALMQRFVSPAMVGLAIGVILLTLLYRDQTFRDTLRYTLQGLALVPVVLAVTVAGTMAWATAILDSTPMRWIGRLSYSLYLWHILAFFVAEHLLPGSGARFVAAMLLGWVLTFVVSWLSYRFVEMPFFALRKRFGSNVETTDHVRA